MKTRIILAALLLLTLLVGTASATEYNYTLLKKINNTTTSPYPTMSEDGYNDLINSTMGSNQDWQSFDLTGILTAVFSPGPANFGPFFWILMFGAIGVFMYIKYDSVLIPGAMYLIGSAWIGPMLLPEFSGIIWAIVVIGFATLGYLLFRSR